MMNEEDERILQLIKEHGRMTVPELLSIMYPKIPEYKKRSKQGNLYRRYRSLQLHHWLDKTTENGAVYWSVQE